MQQSPPLPSSVSLSKSELFCVHIGLEHLASRHSRYGGSDLVTSVAHKGGVTTFDKSGLPAFYPSPHVGKVRPKAGLFVVFHSAGFAALAAEKTISCINLRTGEVEARQADLQENVIKLCKGPGGTLVAVTMTWVLLFHVPSLQPLDGAFKTISNPRGLVGSSDRVLALPGLQKGSLKVVMFQGEEEKESQSCKGFSEGLAALSVARNGAYVVAANESGVCRLFSVYKGALMGEFRASLTSSSSVQSLFLSPHNSYLGVLSRSGYVHVFQTKVALTGEHRWDGPLSPTDKDGNITVEALHNVANTVGSALSNYVSQGVSLASSLLPRPSFPWLSVKLEEGCSNGTVALFASDPFILMAADPGWGSLLRFNLNAAEPGGIWRYVSLLQTPREQGGGGLEKEDKEAKGEAFHPSPQLEGVSPSEDIHKKKASRKKKRSNRSWESNPDPPEATHQQMSEPSDSAKDFPGASASSPSPPLASPLKDASWGAEGGEGGEGEMEMGFEAVEEAPWVVLGEEDIRTAHRTEGGVGRSAQGAEELW